MRKINEIIKKLNWKKYILFATIFIIAVLGIYAILSVIVASIKLGGVQNVKTVHVFNVGMLVFFVVAVVGVIVFFLYNNTKMSKSVLAKNDIENSRWLTIADIKKSNNFIKTTWRKLGNTKEDGILLHCEDKKLNADADIILAAPIHTLVIGTTGSGKTTGFVDSTIQVLSHCGSKPSVVITDPKGELLRKHKETLEKQGYMIRILNLRSPFSSTHWNPFQPALDRIQKLKDISTRGIEFKCGKYCYGDMVKLTYRDAQDSITVYVQELEEEIFTIIQDVIYSVCPLTNKEDTTWQGGARDLIFALALAIAEDIRLGLAPSSALCFYNIHKNITRNLDNEAEGLKAYFGLRLPESKAPALANTVLITKDRTLSSYLTEVSRYAQWFNSTSIQSITSANELEFDDFDEAAHALFIEVPDEKDNFHCLATLLIKQMYKELVVKANKNARLRLTREEELLRNVYFVMDEFGNLPKIDKFDSMITVGRSRHIFFEIIVQDYKQLDNKYGKEVASIIKSNCNNKIFIGSTEPSTIKEFSELCGKKKIRTISISNGKSESANVAVKERPLIYPSELELLNNKDDSGNAIALCFGYSPYRAKITPSFKRKSSFRLQEKEFVPPTPKAFDAKKISYDINNVVQSILSLNAMEGRDTLLAKQPKKRIKDLSSNESEWNVLKNKLTSILPFLMQSDKDMLMFKVEEAEHRCSLETFNALKNLLNEFCQKAEESESISFLLELKNVQEFIDKFFAKKTWEENDENNI